MRSVSFSGRLNITPLRIKFFLCVVISLNIFPTLELIPPKLIFSDCKVLLT